MEVLENLKDAVVTVATDTKEVVTDYFSTETVRSRKETFKTGTIIFLVGIMIGFLWAPIKKGMTIASNNVNSFGDNEAHGNGTNTTNRK